MSGGARRGLQSLSGPKSEAEPMKQESFFFLLGSHLNFVIAIGLISSCVYLARGREMSLPFLILWKTIYKC